MLRQRCSTSKTSELISFPNAEQEIMKQPIKPRQLCFCALFSHGLYKTNIVQVLYVLNSPLCKTDRYMSHVYAGAQKWNFWHTGVGRGVLGNVTTLGTRHFHNINRAHCQLHWDGDPCPKKYPSFPVTAAGHQSLSEPRASPPKEGREPPVQGQFLGSSSVHTP